jgi:myo-inositol catabolism protein IolS
VYNRLDRKAEEQVFPSCQRQDFGVLAREPLANGFLSGKYNPGTVFGRNDWRHLKDQKQLKQVEEIRCTEVPESVNLAQWALAWCLQHPAVTCVIPGCRDVEQLELNAKVAQLELVPDQHPQAWNSQSQVS